VKDNKILMMKMGSLMFKQDINRKVKVLRRKMRKDFYMKVHDPQRETRVRHASWIESYFNGNNDIISEGRLSSDFESNSKPLKDL
jgi:hypothetical protein